MAAQLADVGVAGRKETECTLAHVGEFVRDHRVEPVFGEAEFDETTLGRLQVEHL